MRSKGERIGRSEMRSEKVRKGSVVLFGSCVAEAPTSRCYARKRSLWAQPAHPAAGSFVKGKFSRKRREKERGDASPFLTMPIPLYFPWDHAIKPTSSGRKGVFSKTGTITFALVYATRRGFSTQLLFFRAVKRARTDVRAFAMQRIVSQ